MDRERRLPRGRTEVPVENGKYTVIIDHRPGKEGLVVRRFENDLWLRPEAGGNMLIAMTCELEACRDLLHAIANPPSVSPEVLAKIREVLPRDYVPATYQEEVAKEDDGISWVNLAHLETWFLLSSNLPSISAFELHGDVENVGIKTVYHGQNRVYTARSMSGAMYANLIPLDQRVSCHHPDFQFTFSVQVDSHRARIGIRFLP